MSDMIRNHSNNHDEDGDERESPMKESRRWLKNSHDFKDYELEQRETQREADGKYELDTDMLDLIVLEQLLNEEHKSAAKE